MVLVDLRRRKDLASYPTDPIPADPIPDPVRHCFRAFSRSSSERFLSKPAKTLLNESVFSSPEEFPP